MIRLFAVLSLLLASVPVSTQANSSGMAVLVMSDDRSREWMKSVRKSVRAANLPCPYQVFFGNGDTGAQLSELRTYVRDLENEGATVIVVVPLLTSPYSSSFKQWRYLLGDGVRPGYSKATFFPVKPRASIRFADPLNDSAVVVEILLDRAQEISAQRSEERVVIITQGPPDESDNANYGQILRSLSLRLQERGNFKSVEGFTLRDEATSTVKQRAMQLLRARVQELSAGGSRVILLPYMLTAGGLEHRLSLELRGMGYVLNTKSIYPDSRISDWIRSQVP